MVTPITKRTIVKNVVWNAVEKYSSQGIAFLVSIIMARLLTPTEYGVVGLTSVFISFSDIFINSGLSRALICKKECSIDDYCTANWVNIGVSFICYGILFICAPFIAEFYEQPILVPTMRILTLSLVIGAVSGVSRTILSKEMKFKQMSFITLATSIFSGIIGIVMAYKGFGVWALVYQAVLTSLFSSIWIMWVSGFIPRLIFSKKSFKELFSFGSKILGSDIIWVIFNNIYPLIIGKGFNTQSVGYFTRASSYAGLIPSNFSGVLENVLFPAFSNIQEDEKRLERLYTKALTVSSFFIFTGNFFLVGFAYPLVLNILTEKWVPCVPLLQILCIGTLFGHITSISGRLLMVKGFPGAFLKISVVTKPIMVVFICISLFFGLNGLAWSIVLSSMVTTGYICYVVRQKIGINPLKCLKESFKILILAGVIGIIALNLFKYLIAPSLLNLIIASILFFIFLIVGIKLFVPRTFEELKEIKK